MMVSSRVAELPLAPAAAPTAISGFSSGIGGGSFRLQFLQGIGIVHDLLQLAVEIVVAVELGKQVGKLSAGFEELLERGHLLHHVDRREIVDVLETQFDVYRAPIFAELVFDWKREARAD